MRTSERSARVTVRTRERSARVIVVYKMFPAKYKKKKNKFWTDLTRKHRINFEERKRIEI